jgi:twitching motility two-component system response regulator PilH
MSKVLIADDSFLARQLFIKALKGEGYEVIEAINGQDTMEKVLTQSPDCLLLDLLMPEMDGFAVLKALREEDLSIPVIVVSADVQETSRAKCYELGAVGFLNKPIKKDGILSAIQKAIAPKGGSDK